MWLSAKKRKTSNRKMVRIVEKTMHRLVEGTGSNGRKRGGREATLLGGGRPSSDLSTRLVPPPLRAAGYNKTWHKA